MKKRFALPMMIILICIMLFSGCGFDNVVKKYSKNITSYTIEAEYNDIAQTVSAVETIKYINSYNVPLSYLKLNLYPNAFREGATYKTISTLDAVKAYPNGNSYGDITIQSVKLNGNNITVNVGGDDKNILTVEFASELYPDASNNIEITFMLTLPNINHRFGYGANTINLGNWYPIACVYENGEFFTKPYSYNGDPFYSQIANYKVTFSCPQSYVIANTGVVEAENVANGVKTVTAKAKAVRDFALVLSNKFQVLSQEVGETTVKYYYYDDKNATTSLQTAVDSLNTFNDLIGEYP